MPRIPVDVLPSVQPAGAPGAYVRSEPSPGAFGGYTAQGLERVGGATEELGGSLANQALSYQAIENETNVNDVYSNQFSQSFRNLRNQYYSLRSKDAVTQLPNVTGQMEQLRQDTRDALPNSAQQRMFDVMSRRRVESELDGMGLHADQQAKVWQAQTHSGMLAELLQQSGDQWGDPRVASMVVRSGASEIQAYGKDNGWDDKYIAEETRQFQSQVVDQRVRAAAVHDLDTARTLFDQNKDLMDPKHATTLDSYLTNHEYTQLVRENALEAKQERQAAKALRDQQTLNELPMFADSLQGKFPSAATLAQAVRTQQISPSGANAIIGAAREAKLFQNNFEAGTVTQAVIDAQARFNRGDLSQDDINGLPIPMARKLELTKALGSQGNKADNAVTRGYYDSLKTLLGGHMVEQGIIADKTKAAAQAARWGQAQEEWNVRTRVNGEDPEQVYTDMTRRYVQMPQTPDALPVPRLGAVANNDDVVRVWRQTQAKHDTGEMNDAQFKREAALLQNYRRVFDEQAQTAAKAETARQISAAKGGPKAKLRGVEEQ